MRKLQTAALRRKLMGGIHDMERPEARRALEALADAEQVIDRAATGAVPWREAAERVIIARGAVADALSTVAASRAARRRAGRSVAAVEPEPDRR